MNYPDAVYWQNGQRYVLPNPKTSSMAYANAIAVSNSIVYIVGSDNPNAVYWLNGERYVLPKTGDDAEAWAIAVSGSNVYIAGWDGYNAVYWLNGQRYVLPKTGNLAEALAIAVSGKSSAKSAKDRTKAEQGTDLESFLQGVKDRTSTSKGADLESFIQDAKDNDTEYLRTRLKPYEKNYDARAVAVTYATYATFVTEYKNAGLFKNAGITDIKSFIDENFLDDVEDFIEVIEYSLNGGLETTMQYCASAIGINDLKGMNSAYSYYMSKR
jgi:hypothetical protein